MQDAQQAIATAAGCGCEVYEGEHMFLVDDWSGTRWLCPDCFRDWIQNQSPEELAARMQMEVR